MCLSGETPSVCYLYSGAGVVTDARRLVVSCDDCGGDWCDDDAVQSPRGADDDSASGAEGQSYVPCGHGYAVDIERFSAWATLSCPECLVTAFVPSGNGPIFRSSGAGFEASKDGLTAGMLATVTCQPP